MISNSSSTNSLNSSTPRITTPSQDHNKRNTAPYARGVALCPPLARLASAPLARSRAVVARKARGAGEKDLLCGVRQPAASRSAIAARTPRNTASYPRDAARAGTIAPAQGLPQGKGEPTSSAASARRPPPGFAERRGMLHLTARVAGGRSCGGLPRSPATAFFLFFRAK